MRGARAVTTLFLDIGGVLLTDVELDAYGLQSCDMVAA